MHDEEQMVAHATVRQVHETVRQAHETVRQAHETVRQVHETVRQVAELLTERGETLAAAESATGGLVLSLLTDMPGASAWLRGGIVAYTNDVKRDLLGVPAATLATHGAVSAETALEMARGVRRLCGATWAVGETGIAGPQTGRRSGKPAGLTFIAVVGARNGVPIERAERYLVPDPGERAAVKRAFAAATLALLLDAMRH